MYYFVLASKMFPSCRRCHRALPTPTRAIARPKARNAPRGGRCFKDGSGADYSDCLTALREEDEEHRVSPRVNIIIFLSKTKQADHLGRSEGGRFPSLIRRRKEFDERPGSCGLGWEGNQCFNRHYLLPCSFTSMSDCDVLPMNGATNASK